MKELRQAASIAAFLIVVAMLIHNINGRWLEPTYLGFETPTSYADMALIENAIGSFSFMSSGLAHIVTGFSFMILGLGLFTILRAAAPVGSMLVLLSAILAGLGFLLTGITDIPGTGYAKLLRQYNPESNTEILLTTTMIRGVVNILAIMSLSWFAGQLAWVGRKAGLVSRGFAVFGYVNVLPGILTLFIPPAGFAYIALLPLWMLWLGFVLRKIPDPG